jgi:hypothetical protein
MIKATAGFRRRIGGYALNIYAAHGCAGATRGQRREQEACWRGSPALRCDDGCLTSSTRFAALGANRRMDGGMRSKAPDRNLRIRACTTTSRRARALFSDAILH